MVAGVKRLGSIVHPAYHDVDLRPNPQTVIGLRFSPYAIQMLNRRPFNFDFDFVFDFLYPRPRLG